MPKLGIIVSNATPLIYLAKAGRLDILKVVFGEILISEQVKVEVVDKGKALGRKDAHIVEKAIREGWIKVRKTQLIEVPVKLDKGEVSVLSLAKKAKSSVVLLDESSARLSARLLGLTPRGTIFVLLKALEMKKIDLSEFLKILNNLIDEGFRLKEEVYIEAVRAAREITKEE